MLLFYLFMAGICVLFEAFFSGSETALISSSKLFLKARADRGYLRARLAVRLLEHPEKLLATTLVGTNLSVVLGTTLMTLAMEQLVSERWESVVTVLVMTPIVLVFGELVPKAFCRANPDSITLWVVGPLVVAQRVMMPLVVVVTFIAHQLIRLIGDTRGEPNAYAKRQELKILAELGEREGFLQEEQKKMIHGALDLETTPVSSAMVALVDVVALDEEGSVAELTSLAAETGFSRFPVYQDRVDNVVGIVPLMDVLYDKAFRGHFLLGDVGTAPIAPYVRKDILFVPETKSVGSLLHDLMSNEMPMAMIVDEHGGVVGLATREDLIEEVVGEIQDERDEEGDGLVPMEEGVFICDGSMELDELEERTGIVVQKEGFETVAGLVLKLAGKIPSPGEVYGWQSYKIEVLESTTRRVNRVRFTRIS